VKFNHANVLLFIYYFLVNESKNKVQNELVAKLYREDLFAELLEESPQIASRREV